MRCLLGFLWTTWICGLITLLSSCGTVEKILVPEVHRSDSIRIIRIHDSTKVEKITKIKDSTSTIQRGDTVFHTVYHSEKVVDMSAMMKMISDSLAKHQVDTITKIQRVEVEKKLSLWDQIMVDFGTYVMCILLIGLIGLTLLFILKRIRTT
jgi:hypothetical protein